MKKASLFVICFLLFAFRIFLAVNAKHGDMYNNLDWGKGAVNYGLAQFYELPKEAWPHSRPNQPPGSIFFHAFSHQFNLSIDQIIRWSNSKLPAFPSRLVWWWEFHGELVSIKLPSILADFAIAAAILALSRSRLLAFVYLLNPALWYDSSFWGQTDSIVAALALWSLVFLARKRLFWSPVFLGLSLITKASWAPILPLYLLFWLKHYPRKLLLLAAIPITALLITLPFHPHLDLPVWTANLYLSRILPGESAYATVNAFNLWNLIFGPKFIPDTTPFLSIPANIIGLILVASFLLICLRKLWAKTTLPILFYTAALLFFSVFLFSTRMHERYLYPIFPLMTLLLFRSRQLIFIYILLSLTFILNLYHDWWSPSSSFLISLYTILTPQLVSLVNLLVFAWLLGLKSLHEAAS